MGDDQVTDARDALLVVVARLEGKFDSGMVELRAGVASIESKFQDHVRRTEDKQREFDLRLERKADMEQTRGIDNKLGVLWDRHNRSRGAQAVVALILTIVSVYAALRASGVHF